MPNTRKSSPKGGPIPVLDLNRIIHAYPPLLPTR